MSIFEKREAGEERKFALDAEVEFKARARRNRQVGHWAAGKLGLSGAAADTYAAELVAADLEEQGDGDVIRKLKADFAKGRVDVSDVEITTKLSTELASAVAEMKNKG